MALAAALNDFQRRQVVTGHGRIVQQPDQQRGNHFDMRDAVLFDQRANVFGLGAGAEHHAAAVKKKTLNAGTRQRQVVRDRQNDQQDGILADGANSEATLEL